MKLASFFALSFFGFSNVCRSEPLGTIEPTEPLGTLEPTDEDFLDSRETTEFQIIDAFSGLVTESLNALGGQEAISKAITAAMNPTQGRRALEEVDNVALLGDDAADALSGAVEHWLDGLPDDMRGDVGRRNLQRIDYRDLVKATVEAVACTILSLFVDNILYSQVEDRDDYDDNIVCLEEDECPGRGLKTVEFVSENAKGHEFLYHDNGPDQLQGVFWLNYRPFCSSMVSFAETVEEFPLSTGQLREPGLPLFPLANAYDDFAYNIRVAGASNWAFSEGRLCYPAAEFLDLIYGFKLGKRKSGPATTDDPTKFVIVPSIKIPFTDFRVSLDSECTVDTTGFAVLRFEMALVQSCRRILLEKLPGWRKAKAACEAGAKVWRRDTWWLSRRKDGPTFSYYVIQIVDGNGDKTNAYDDFVAAQAIAAPDGYPVNEFSSLKASKASKKGDNPFCRRKKRR